MKVRCINAINSGGNNTEYLTIGKEYTVTSIGSNNMAWIKDDVGDVIYIYTDGRLKHGEFEIVQEAKEMTKSDLVPGKHVVEMDDGTLFLVLQDIWAQDTSYCNPHSYTEDFKYKHSGDIYIKAVYEIECNTLNKIFNKSGLTEIWRRESAEYTELMDKIKAHEESLADLKAQAEKLKGV